MKAIRTGTFLCLILPPLLTLAVQTAAVAILVNSEQANTRKLASRLTGLALEHRYVPGEPRILVRTEFRERIVRVPYPVEFRTETVYIQPSPENISGVSPERVPGELIPLLDRGIAALRSGALSEAEECFRTILTLSPGSAEAAGWLSAVLMGEPHPDDSDREEIRALAEQAVSLGAEIPEPYIVLGHLALNEGNRTEAVRYFASALSLDPENESLRALMEDLL